MNKQRLALFLWDLFETSVVQIFAYTSTAMALGAFAGLFSAHAVMLFGFWGGLVTGLVKTWDAKVSHLLGEPAPLPVTGPDAGTKQPNVP